MNRERCRAYPSGWFAVAWSDELRSGESRSCRYFGRDLVLFRGRDGAAHVLEAYCPHLGAHLGVGGKVVGSCIRCPFHAWEFDGAGACTRVPYARKIPKNASVRSFPTRDVSGYVMAYFDHTRRAPEFDVVDLTTSVEPVWRMFGRRAWTIRTQNAEVVENTVDRAHFHYIHDYDEVPHTEAEIEGDGHTFRTVFRSTARFLRLPIDATVEFSFRGVGLATTRLAAPAKIAVVSSTTPIDEQHVDHRNSYWIDRAVSPIVRSILGRLVMRRAAQEVAKDVSIWENKSYRSRPVLCDGDGPIMKFRRWYARYLVDEEATP